MNAKKSSPNSRGSPALKPQVIEDNHLRVDSGVFRKQLLHDQGLILGAYDARITGRDDDPAAPYPGF